MESINSALFYYVNLGGKYLNITLVKDGEKKTYSQFFVPAKHMRKTLELRKDINFNNLTEENVDTVANFVVEVFEKQFTYDDLLNGLSYDDLIPTIFEDIFMNILQGRKQEVLEEEGNEKKEL